MSRNAGDHVNSSLDSMRNVITSLEQAQSSCEKESNKKIIQSAIASINCAYDHLCEYCD